ncbi:ferritin [Mesosutterella multiformis]|uniref:ferritin n=1 Tax=Mesosutterella multiformis TaxID=2259133 RepID=UPI00190F848D|nr:ferritin [Mesosutterella multiformis]
MNANVSLLLNEQINKEFYSAYLYLDFANYYAAVGLDGFENWYRVQAQEERDHAMLFCQYLQNNGEGVTFEAIAKPEWERGDHMAPLKRALEHEMLVTASINAIYAAAYESGTSAPCRCWTGSSRNRVRRRRTPLTSLPRWICSAVTARGCIC